MRLRAIIAAMILACSSSAALAHEPSSMAQYIANEAILVSHGETKVLFDPLPLSGFGVYPQPTPTDIAKMMSGQGEYEGVDVVFISHAHRDHFSAIAMITYLTANPDVRLVAPKQALDMMQANANWDPALESRMTILDMKVGDEAQAISIGDITATAVRIPHAGWPAPARFWGSNRHAYGRRRPAPPTLHLAQRALGRAAHGHSFSALLVSDIDAGA